MQQLVAGLQGQAQQDTPLGKAQALMYPAFEEADEQRRVQLAKDALAICPDCTDTYVLLAEYARSRKEAMRLYEQGVAAGERALVLSLANSKYSGYNLPRLPSSFLDEDCP